MRQLFDNHDFLFIQQRKELAEIIIDFETKNRYLILDQKSNKIGLIEEQGSGLAIWIKRIFLRSHRPFEIEVVFDNQKILGLSRKFFFFFSDLFIQNNAGKHIGSVHRRFGLIYKKYDLYDEHHQLFAKINCPIWRIWSFEVYNRMDRPIALISKKWSGVLKEVFTDADRFGVQFKNQELTTEQKAVIFATSISIDFDFFENNSKNGGLLNWFD